MNQPKKSVSPWTIIGWIFLAMILLPIAFGVAVVVVGQVQDAHQRGSI